VQLIAVMNGIEENAWMRITISFDMPEKDSPGSDPDAWRPGSEPIKVPLGTR
jgi:hypothetical protein